MNRSKYIAWVVVAGLGFSGLTSSFGATGRSQLISEAEASVNVASAAVEEARAAIAEGKQLLAMIPADSPIIEEVTQMLQAVKKNWSLSVSALEGAKESASKIASASSSEIAQDYKLLATVNSGVALSGANVVQTALKYIEAAAMNKSEALDIIEVAVDESLQAAEQVQLNYDRVKSFIAQKYSK